MSVLIFPLLWQIENILYLTLDFEKNQKNAGPKYIFRFKRYMNSFPS